MECLVACGVSVAGEAVNSCLAKTKKHIGYLYNYKENLSNLEVAVETLDVKRNDMSRFAEDSHRQHKDVSSTAGLWQPEADDLHQKAQELFDRHNISCLNPCLRYSTSKHAWEMTQEIDEKVKSALDFGNDFDRPAPKLGAKFDLTGFIEFESRTLLVHQIWKALQDNNVRMLSICGVGGIGKTTLAKKLVQRVESERLFDNIAMATVSQNPNLRKLRGDIMSSLGWKFDSEELETSYKLFDCLINNGDESICLILDDVQEVLDFEKIGIPKGKLKIVLDFKKGEGVPTNGK